MKIEQYKVVRLLAIHNPELKNQSGFGSSYPVVGDVATVIDVFTTPCDAYHLECSNQDGSTAWDIIAKPTELELEIVADGT